MDNSTQTFQVRPCPFCNSRVHMLVSSLDALPPRPDGEERFAVVCDGSAQPDPGCGAAGGFMPTLQGAVDVWNERHEEKPSNFWNVIFWTIILLALVDRFVYKFLPY